MSHLKYTRYFGPYVYFSYRFRIILDDFVAEYTLLASLIFAHRHTLSPNFTPLKTCDSERLFPDGKCCIVISVRVNVPRPSSLVVKNPHCCENISKDI